MKELLRAGVVANYTDMAQLGHMSRARMSQIMELTELAPAIQEELLFLPKTMQGSDYIHERALRPIAKQIDWEQQRRLFRSVMDQAAKQRG